MNGCGEKMRCYIDECQVNNWRVRLSVGWLDLDFREANLRKIAFLVFSINIMAYLCKYIS